MLRRCIQVLTGNSFVIFGVVVESAVVVEVVVVNGGCDGIEEAEKLSLVATK